MYCDKCFVGYVGTGFHNRLLCPQCGGLLRSVVVVEMSHSPRREEVAWEQWVEMTTDHGGEGGSA